MQRLNFKQTFDYGTSKENLEHLIRATRLKNKTIWKKIEIMTNHSL